MKTETCKLYSRDFWIFLPKASKSISIILSYTVSKLVHFLDTVYKWQFESLYKTPSISFESVKILEVGESWEDLGTLTGLLTPLGNDIRGIKWSRTDDVTWPWKVKLVTPIRLEPDISKTAGYAI